MFAVVTAVYEFIMEMIFMKKMISILLVLAFCLSLACPAFAAASSPTGSGPRPMGNNPKTGDVIMFWVAIMAVSVMALGAVYCVYRRKFSK